ncbi:MAG: hypothetical protein ABFS37_04325 [Acidobacteriota bacterium]
MQRRNRSPGLAMVLLVGCALITTPAFSGEIQEGEIQGPEQTAGHLLANTATGLAVQASFSPGTVAEPSCRKGKRILGTSPNFVVRASLKVLLDDCHDCCSENILFIDGFESNNTSNWSATVGG